VADSLLQARKNTEQAKGGNMNEHRELLENKGLDHHIKQEGNFYVLYDEHNEPAIKYNIRKPYIDKLAKKLDKEN